MKTIEEIREALKAAVAVAYGAEPDESAESTLSAAIDELERLRAEVERLNAHAVETHKAERKAWLDLQARANELESSLDSARRSCNEKHDELERAREVQQLVRDYFAKSGHGFCKRKGCKSCAIRRLLPAEEVEGG